MASEFYIGKRLSFDERLCTVRYIGEVKGTKGTWLGVEWDDPIRGKHSGEHAGTRYFQCVRNHPTAGSFVRPTRKPDPSRSFVEALKAKYASEDFEDPDVEVVFVTKNDKKERLVQQNRPVRISGKEVEEVGFDKIRKQLAELSELKFVILDGLRMSRPVASRKESQNPSEWNGWPTGLKDVSDACPKVIELDLSRNLFEEWREVVSICEQLDKLKSLRVDGNRFRDTTLTETEKERARAAFRNIKAVKMEDNFLPWDQVAEVTNLFPQITSFVASSNFYTTLTDDILNSTITDLTFEENSFHSFSDLISLTKLPNLRRLVLKSNQISEVTNTDALPVFSPTLTELDLSYNEISSWAFIDKLVHIFPGLTSLRVSHNPLYNSLRAADGRALSAEDGYMLTLARLKNLKTLNYSPITDKERLNAESYYLSLIAREVTFAPRNQEEQILATHPRYKELCEEYGEPVIKREDNAVNPNSLAARLMRISFHQGKDDSGQLVGAPFEIEIPRSSTVYTVLGLVGKHYGFAPRRCKLIWETGDWMPATGASDSIDGDSASESGEDGENRTADKVKGESVMREVEIVPGTRSIGTWIDGREAFVRIEHS
ncbi:tubulin-specific chaperone E [Aaosphaeria arxii CBS 175.79]|uniref:Tubulin-specific chaperone E n=1 Tax=Aaosphaeria arxii CBS 175.79 TaxID=1450172 RepID=A0A6A5Y0D5_9PLEO|nr:tubulin-specific chaperone E [Aaosphaeria arxii CBS 175.79]KAF2018686.1 tubulin-specific chaperone E [Aaosphaeria arxii CBS 175.79]